MNSNSTTRHQLPQLLWTKNNIGKMKRKQIIAQDTGETKINRYYKTNIMINMAKDLLAEHCWTFSKKYSVKIKWISALIFTYSMPFHHVNVSKKLIQILSQTFKEFYNNHARLASLFASL